MVTKSKTLQEAAKKYLEQNASDSVGLNFDLQNMSNADYLVAVTGAKLKERPKTSSLLEMQKLAGERPDVKVEGNVTIDVILRKAEIEDANGE